MKLLHVIRWKKSMSAHHFISRFPLEKEIHPLCFLSVRHGVQFSSISRGDPRLSVSTRRGHTCSSVPPGVRQGVQPRGFGVLPPEDPAGHPGEPPSVELQPGAHQRLQVHKRCCCCCCCDYRSARCVFIMSSKIIFDQRNSSFLITSFN